MQLSKQSITYSKGNKAAQNQHFLLKYLEI